jgi:hypothetical protein
MSEGTRKTVELLRERIRRATRRILYAEIIYGLIIVLAIASGLWLALVLIESIAWMSVAGRTVAYVLFLAASLGAAAFFLAPPLVRLLVPRYRPRDEDTALRIGSAFPPIGDRLSNVLDLASGHSSRAPNAMIDRAVASLEQQVSPIAFEKYEDFSRPRRASRFGAWLPAVLVLSIGFAPEGFRNASGRLVDFRTAFEPPAPFSISVYPGDVDRSRGEALDISATTSGDHLPAGASVVYLREDSEREDFVEMRTDGMGRFSHRFDAVSTPFRYRVEADGVSSGWFSVGIVDRPFIRELQVEVEYPAYSGMPPTRLGAQRGDVTALRGSTVRVRSFLAGPDVGAAYIELTSGERIPMEVEDGAAVGAFDVRSHDEYAVVLQSTDGTQNLDPIRYEVRAVDDEAPSVSLLSPEPDHSLSDDLTTTVVGKISDDYGFSRLRLNYRLVESRYRTPSRESHSVSIPIDTPRPREQDVAIRWRVSEGPLDPVPGDVIEYYLEVWDNDAISGAKAGRSAVHRVRVPSLTERYRDTDAQQRDIQDEMQRLMDDAQDFRQQFDRLQDDLRGRREADWQDRRQVETLQQRQEQMQDRADELSRKMESLTREMEENNLLTPETLETYKELQRVIEEINSPELMEALQQLQEALEELDLGKMQESMQEFRFNEEQYKQRLERTLELFKRARAMQQIEQAQRMAEEVARQQENIREQTESLDQQDAAGQEGQNAQQDPTDSAGGDQGDAREQVAQDQERLADDMSELEEKLDQIGDQLREINSGQREEMERLREQIRKEQLPEKMRQTSDQIRGNQSQDAQQSQQSTQEQLDNLQQQLSDMRAGMAGAQLNLNLSGLRRTLRDIIQLSRDQEGMQNATVQEGAGSPGLRDKARGQMRLAEGVGMVADSLQSLAGQIPEMTREVQRHTGDALREMQQATEALADRSAREASTRQRASMMHLNELALMLSDLLDQLMNQQSGDGEGGMSVEDMADELRQLSEQQRSLNQQIQQFLNETQGERMNVDQQERLRQMSAQQDEIRRQLRNLSREPLARDELLRDFNRIAEEMSETIRELERRGASRETIERQQQILTRLLEAERSLQQRGEEERRRGRTGDQIHRESPPELDERQREIETLRRDLIRALESDYSQDYQQLIRRYFELLQRQAQPEQRN